MSSNSAAPAAVAATTASDDTMVIVSSVLSEFHDQNAPATVVSSSKILVKLLQNAIKETDDPKKQEMYRKVRMGNAKIQQHVVNVPGACDVLGLAGFSEEKIDNDRFLVYYPQQQKPGEDNALELYLAEGDQPKENPSHALIHAICQGLEAKQKELEAQKEQQQSPSKPAPSASSSSNVNNNNSPFLSEEERLKRAAKVKAMKQAKKKERAAAKERWNEDEERRKEAKQRREALLNAKVQEEAKQGLAANITVRTTADNFVAFSPAKQNLPKPFEIPPSSDPKEQLAAAARARMQRAQASKPAPTQAVPAAAANDETAMDVEAPPVAVAAALPKEMTQQPSKDDVPMEAEEEEAEEEKWENQKPAAKPAEQAQQPQPPQFMPVRPVIERTPEWDAFLERVPRCAGAEGIRESSVFAKEGGDGMVVPQCLKRLFKELDGLKDSLPADPNCSIWLRFDEETPQYIRALMAAPLPGPSPYSGGLFAFDIFVPGDYPQVSPKVQFLSTGGGTWRAGPNLYACGKVCLSLLGTWSGEKWNPAHSSLYQVLLSIQGLILGVEHPFYLEPGHGGWEGNVKDGAFQQSGQTLAGEKVQTEVGVPQNVVIFEDLIRVGTTKYAMIQPLKAAARLLHDKDGSSKKKDSMFAAFGEIIQTHFGHSREAVLTEVRTWMTDHCVGRNRKVVSGSLTIDQLQDLMPKLEQLLSEIPSLAGGAPLESTNDDAMVTEEEDKKVAAKPPPPAAAGDTKPASSAAKRTTSGETKPASVDFVEAKRQKMQEAASQGDYVLAGQLQEEVKRLEDLQRSIQEAAQQNDFIRAGRLQAQLKALTATDDTKKPARKKAPPKAMWDQGGDDDDDMLDDDDEDVDDDDSMDSDDEPVGGGGGPPFAMGGGGPPFGMGGGGGMAGAPHFPPHGLGKNVFAPPGYKSKFANKHHSWGTGNALGNTASEAPPEEEKVAAKPAPAAAKKKSIPPEQLCRLRIRLPNNKSVIEDFDKEDQLSAVYRRLAPMVPEDGTKKKKKSNTVSQPASASGTGAFAKPLSSAGFTLLLTRPKREFSLEMHGVKTLLDLNLAPSATLTVMKCSDRGIMYRGELESRLQGAQGDAMEVDGLTYEGLVELTERVGAAAPDMNEEDLENNTETLSPAAYLAELDASMEEVSEAARKCPICLGAYDAQDTTGSLRKLKNCGHIFHCGCVETWLETKASCPLCKTSVKPEK